jgi:hypothetical protein
VVEARVPQNQISRDLYLQPNPVSRSTPVAPSHTDSRPAIDEKSQQPDQSFKLFRSLRPLEVGSSGLRLGRSKTTADPTPQQDMPSRPLPARADSLELRLIALKPKNLPSRTRDFYHWALRPGPVGSGRGDLFHSRVTPVPDHLNPNQQHHSCQSYLPPLTKPGTGFVIFPGYGPKKSARQSLHMQTKLSDRVAAADLHSVCTLVNERYPYALLQTNCQNFTIRLLRQLVFEGLLSLQQYDFVASATYTSVLGAWKRIRNQSQDLRTLEAGTTES